MGLEGECLIGKCFISDILAPSIRGHAVVTESFNAEVIFSSYDFEIALFCPGRPIGILNQPILSSSCGLAPPVNRNIVVEVKHAGLISEDASCVIFQL